jgi:hypothetical protein
VILANTLCISNAQYIHSLTHDVHAMPHFVIEGDPIHIAYGFDPTFSGVFLSVYDNRLKYDPDASKKVNDATESISSNGGGGCYLDLHTGISGFGQRVNDVTMSTYLKRFGVSEERIAQLPLVLPKTTTTLLHNHEPKVIAPILKPRKECNVLIWCALLLLLFLLLGELLL